MRAQRAGLATKLLILLLLMAALLALLSARTRLEEARRELEAVNRQVQAQREINAGLAGNGADGGADGALDVARARLGLVEPDEKVFVDANH